MHTEPFQPDPCRIVTANTEFQMTPQQLSEVESLHIENRKLREELRAVERERDTYSRELSRRMAAESPPLTEAEEAEIEAELDRFRREGPSSPSIQDFIRELRGDVSDDLRAEIELDKIIRLQRDLEDIESDRDRSVRRLLDDIDQAKGLVTFGETRYIGGKPISDVRAWLDEVVGDGIPF